MNNFRFRQDFGGGQTSLHFVGWSGGEDFTQNEDMLRQVCDGSVGGEARWWGRLGRNRVCRRHLRIYIQSIMLEFSNFQELVACMLWIGRKFIRFPVID